MGTKTGKKNYMEIFITDLDIDLSVATDIATVRASLIADESTVFFGRLVDGGHGLRAGGSFKWTRDGEAMWDGIPEGTVTIEAVAVGYDEAGDNSEYTKLNTLEGERKYAYQLDSLTGLARKVGILPIYIDEDSTGNTQETFTIKGTENGEKSDLWQRMVLPLTAP